MRVPYYLQSLIFTLSLSLPLPGVPSPSACSMHINCIISFVSFLCTCLYGQLIPSSSHFWRVPTPSVTSPHPQPLLTLNCTAGLSKSTHNFVKYIIWSWIVQSLKWMATESTIWVRFLVKQRTPRRYCHVQTRFINKDKLFIRLRLMTGLKIEESYLHCLIRLHGAMLSGNYMYHLLQQSVTVHFAHVLRVPYVFHCKQRLFP
jgi:hypothetical protein